MQTFLPYANFAESARVLDMRRLGKQRVETLQILQALDRSRHPSTWRNHPAVRMWRGHEAALVTYGRAICTEWRQRGYRDTCLDKINDLFLTADYDDTRNSFYEDPSWLDDETFHLAHRSNLIRKLPEHYGPLWPDVPNDLPYVWPV